MRFTFNIEVEVERAEGKFESRDEIGALILEWLENCNEGSLEGGNGGQYEVTDWSVDEVPQPTKRKAQPGALRRDDGSLMPIGHHLP